MVQGAWPSWDIEEGTMGINAEGRLWMYRTVLEGIVEKLVLYLAPVNETKALKT